MKQTWQIPENMTVAILAGGLGTRLRPLVSDRPKVLAEVAGRPFLAWWLSALEQRGARSIVLCTGYKSEIVERTFGSHFGRADLIYSAEPEPLGTGGALRLAVPHCQSSEILVINGDSYCEPSFGSFVASHVTNAAVASMVLTQVEDCSRYGRVTMEQDQRITEFVEKGTAQGPGWVNAGVYCIRKNLLKLLPTGVPFSLECDLLPEWLEGRVYGFSSPSPFIDIGTPESYAAAESFFERIVSGKRSALRNATPAYSH